jgi:hypothetical protein
MKVIVIVSVLPFMLLLFSCAAVRDDNDDNIIYFEDYPHGRVWVGKKDIDIEPMKSIDGRRRYTRITFDPVSSKLWAWNLSNDFQYLYLADITSGAYVAEKEILLNVYMNLGVLFVFINEDNFLIEHRWGLYSTVDLSSVKQNIIDLREILDSNITGGTIGYDGNVIFFSAGYYDIKGSTYHPYSIVLSHPRLISNDHKIIGMDKDNYINVYDYLSNDVKVLAYQINRFNTSLNYSASDLYFLEGDNLYIANNTLSLKNILIFAPRPAHRKWFKYDLITAKRKNIDSPSGYSKILGRNVKFFEGMCQNSHTLR